MLKDWEIKHCEKSLHTGNLFWGQTPSCNLCCLLVSAQWFFKLSGSHSKSFGDFQSTVCSQRMKKTDKWNQNDNKNNKYLISILWGLLIIYFMLSFQPIGFCKLFYALKYIFVCLILFHLAGFTDSTKQTWKMHLVDRMQSTKTLSSKLQLGSQIVFCPGRSR